jgi:hypothetical protein
VQTTCLVQLLFGTAYTDFLANVGGQLAENIDMYETTLQSSAPVVGAVCFAILGCQFGLSDPSIIRQIKTFIASVKHRNIAPT